MTHRFARTLLVIVVGLIIGGAALIGLGGQALNIAVLGVVLLGIVDRLWGLHRRDVVVAPWRKSEDRPWRAHRKQLALRLGFGLLWASTFAGTLRVMSVFDPDALPEVGAFFGIALLLWLILALFPRRTVDLAHNLGLGAAILALALAWLPTALPQPQPVTLSLPVRNEVAVIQGGPTPLDNHHYLVSSQRYAIDLLWIEDGLAVSPQTGETIGFGRPVLAPANGEVVTVVDGFEDGELQPNEPAGNHVVIAMADGRYVLLAHLAHDSIEVREGDTVSAGDRIGALGNSGNSSMAHLHLQVQDGPRLTPDIETFPIRFGDATPLQDGPRRGDRIHPEPRLARR